jgi:flavin reductase (DIM6/NTAB) family NADH-FMN oxidoreductase RutF
MLQKIGSQNVLYPMPVTLVGTVVEGRINFLNIAHVGIFNAASPHRISLGMAKSHWSNKGIRANGTFSINMPSVDMMIETDHAGLVSGRSADKSKVFETFFGSLEHAPLIATCPVAMACKLVETIDTPTHDVFVGEVVETYADPSVLTDGVVDLGKVRPLLFDMSTRSYFAIGERVGRCWHEGKTYGK